MHVIDYTKKINMKYFRIITIKLILDDDVST